MEKNPYEIIRTNYPSYSKVFRVIADYILNHSDEVLKTNIHKLGRDLDIAESSIIHIVPQLRQITLHSWIFRLQRVKNHVGKIWPSKL